MSSDRPAVLLVREDSASLPRPKREVPLRPVVEARLPPSLFRRPPEAPRVPAPPREEDDVVPPEVPRPVFDATALPIDDPLLRVVEEPLLVTLLPPRLALLEAPLLPPPLEACPPFLATAVFVFLLAEAKPRPPVDAVLFEVPLEADLLAALLVAVLLAPPLDDEEPPRDAPLELPLRFPPFDAVLELVPFDAPLREDDEPPRLLEDPPRLDVPLLAPPREELPLEAVLDAPLLAALLFEAVAPPRLADLKEELFPPRFAAAVLPAAPRDEDLEAVLDAVFEAPFELPPRLDDLEAALDPPLDAAFVAVLEALLEVPLDADLDAVFDAPFELERPPPFEACPPFFAAAFLVAFAMFNGFCYGLINFRC